MTNLIIIFGLTAFCIIQAFYWHVQKKAQSRAASLLEKLGGQVEVQDVSLFHSDENKNPLVERFEQMLVEAGDEPDLGPLLSKFVIWSCLLYTSDAADE